MYDTHAWQNFQIPIFVIVHIFIFDNCVDYDFVVHLVSEFLKNGL